jgi:hypothetical protein
MRARRDRLAVEVLSEKLHEAEIRAFWLEQFYEATVVMVERRDRRVAELERLLDQAWRVVQAMRVELAAGVDRRLKRDGGE